MTLTKRLSAEFIGTLWLILGGCGTAVLAGSLAGNTGIALAFGLTVLTMAYAIGHISGCHLNPAVTLGLWAGRRFPAGEVVPYILSQVLGAIAGAGLLYFIARGKPGFVIGNFAANGFGEYSPGKYDVTAGFATEVLMTFFFLVVVLGVTHRLGISKAAPVAIGLCLTLIHLVSLPVTNASVNPARSTGPALLLSIVSDTWAVKQLWLFWVAPILGALLAGFAYSWLVGDESPVEVAKSAVDDIKETVEEAKDAVKDTVEDVKDTVKETVEEVKDTVKDKVESQKDSVKTAAN